MLHSGTQVFELGPPRQASNAEASRTMGTGLPLGKAQSGRSIRTIRPEARREPFVFPADNAPEAMAPPPGERRGPAGKPSVEGGARPFGAIRTPRLGIDARARLAERQNLATRQGIDTGAKNRATARPDGDDPPERPEELDTGTEGPGTNAVSEAGREPATTRRQLETDEAALANGTGERNAIPAPNEGPITPAISAGDGAATEVGESSQREQALGELPEAGWPSRGEVAAEGEAETKTSHGAIDAAHDSGSGNVAGTEEVARKREGGGPEESASASSGVWNADDARRVEGTRLQAESNVESVRPVISRKPGEAGGTINEGPLTRRFIPASSLSGDGNGLPADNTLVGVIPRTDPVDSQEVAPLEIRQESGHGDKQQTGDVRISRSGPLAEDRTTNLAANPAARPRQAAAPWQETASDGRGVESTTDALEGPGAIRLEFARVAPGVRANDNWLPADGARDNGIAIEAESVTSVLGVQNGLGIAGGGAGGAEDRGQGGRDQTSMPWVDARAEDSLGDNELFDATGASSSLVAGGVAAEESVAIAGSAAVSSEVNRSEPTGTPGAGASSAQGGGTGARSAETNTAARTAARTQAMAPSANAQSVAAAAGPVRSIRIRLPIVDGLTEGSIQIELARRNRGLEVRLAGSNAGLQQAVTTSIDSLVRKLAADAWTPANATGDANGVRAALTVGAGGLAENGAGETRGARVGPDDRAAEGGFVTDPDGRGQFAGNRGSSEQGQAGTRHEGTRHEGARRGDPRGGPAQMGQGAWRSIWDRLGEPAGGRDSAYETHARK